VRTATPNDSLSTGPSGAGYAYPQLYSPVHKTLFGQATGELMNMSGVWFSPSSLSFFLSFFLSSSSSSSSSLFVSKVEVRGPHGADAGLVPLP
jgi:hypothetical protein